MHGAVVARAMVSRKLFTSGATAPACIGLKSAAHALLPEIRGKPIAAIYLAFHLWERLKEDALGVAAWTSCDRNFTGCPPIQS